MSQIGVRKMDPVEGLEADLTSETVALGKREQLPEELVASNHEGLAETAAKVLLTSNMKPAKYIGYNSEMTGTKSIEDSQVTFKAGSSGAITDKYNHMKEALEREEALEKLKPDDRTLAQRMKEQNEKAAKYFVSIGPARISTTVKHTNTIDYNPSRCKDFFEAGYCVFGNSCIFIHDRCDYKFGWQLDQEFEAKQKKKQERRQKRLEAIIAQKDLAGLGLDSTDSEDETTLLGPAVYAGIDLVCPVCKQDYKNPTSLGCKHILCDICARNEYSKTGKCPKCSKRMDGVFNSGFKTLQRALEEKSERKAKYDEAKREKKKAQNYELPTYLREEKTYRQRGEQADNDEPTLVSEEQINQAFARISNQRSGHAD